MEDNGGINGDTFMNRIQKIASTTPYMTSVGSVPASLSGARSAHVA
jgi:hypothetical protein